MKFKNNGSSNKNFIGDGFVDDNFVIEILDLRPRSEIEDTYPSRHRRNLIFSFVKDTISFTMSGVTTFVTFQLGVPADADDVDYIGTTLFIYNFSNSLEYTFDPIVDNTSDGVKVTVRFTEAPSGSFSGVMWWGAWFEYTGTSTFDWYPGSAFNTGDYEYLVI